MTAQKAREKVIEQHTVQKTVSDILFCIRREVERQGYHFDEDMNEFYIKVDYNYNLDGVVKNRTEQVIQELNNLGFEVVKSLDDMFIYW